MKKKKRTKICRVCGTEFTVREHRNGQRICDDCLERLGHEWKEWKDGRYQQRQIFAVGVHSPVRLVKKLRHQTPGTELRMSTCS